MKRSITRVWTEEEESRLRQLCEQGATLMRAAAVLERSASGVWKMARELGFQLPGVRAVRAGLRGSEAIVPAPKRS